ncbi:hypothetical protein AYJ54_36390 [Bradyrhizobium centrolobii]|uniref:Uncharacterized protein n=1 Tax=Bradyrhizobium centrolobii TaxID=1505087 RepID=A0A176Y7X4_9BRAD|nr:hypothetical protein [Bradyrhizobium centrolobii]OAE96761.1 hypothetical protein AYJ54_36390 [Bradyrhizobium centrolobii]
MPGYGEVDPEIRPALELMRRQDIDTPTAIERFAQAHISKFMIPLGTRSMMRFTREQHQTMAKILRATAQKATGTKKLRLASLAQTGRLLAQMAGTGGMTPEAQSPTPESGSPAETPPVQLEKAAPKMPPKPSDPSAS